MGVRQDVQGNRIAVAAAFGLQHRRRRCRDEGLGQLSCGNETPGVDDPLVVRTAPERVVPVDDVALRVERCAHLGHHRRREVIPRVLLIAHPLHAHRLGGERHCDQRRMCGRVVGAVMAVAARAFGMDAADLFLRHREHFRQPVAQRVDALGVGPNGEGVVFEDRHRARRTNRTMQQVALDVGRIQRLHRRCRSPVRVGDFDVLRAKGLELLMDGSGIGQRASGAPFAASRERSLCEYGLPFALGHDGEHIAISDDLHHAGHFHDLGLVGLEQIGVVGRRHHSTGMHHVRQVHVLHVAGAAREFARYVQTRERRADDLERARIFQ